MPLVPDMPVVPMLAQLCRATQYGFDREIVSLFLFFHFGEQGIVHVRVLSQVIRAREELRSVLHEHGPIMPVSQHCLNFFYVL